MIRRKQVSPYYLAIKNYIHNELKLTKEDIREIIKEVVHEEVNRYLSREGYLYGEVRSQIRQLLWEKGFDYQAAQFVRNEVEKQIKNVRVVVELKEDEDKSNKDKQ